MEEILTTLVNGIIQHLEWNDEIEEKLQKIIRAKVPQIVSLLHKKGISAQEFEVQENMIAISERLVSKLLFERMSAYVRRFIDYPIWDFYGMTSIIKDNYIAYFLTHLKEKLKSGRMRKIYYDIYNLIESNYIDRYSQSLYNRKGYGHLYVFSKPVTNHKILKEFLHLAAFFYPIALEGIQVKNETCFMDNYLKNTDTSKEFFHLLKEYVFHHFDRVPEEIFKTGVEASINKNQLNFDMGLNIRADLLRSLLLLCKFKQKQATSNNKRAESPEKSLFSIFQKQSDFFGLEKNLLYELELVARENKW